MVTSSEQPVTHVPMVHDTPDAQQKHETVVSETPGPPMRLADGWQLKSDMPHRKKSLGTIVALMQRHKPDSEWIEKVPSVARRLEDSLYTSARPFDTYDDRTTLRELGQKGQEKLEQRAQRGQEGEAPFELNVSAQNLSNMLLDLTPEEQKKQELLDQQQRLLMLRHASICTAPLDMCILKRNCAETKKLLGHSIWCKDNNCEVDGCIITRSVLGHFHGCQDLNCGVCAPVEDIIDKEGTDIELQIMTASSQNVVQQTKVGRQCSLVKKRMPLRPHARAARRTCHMCQGIAQSECQLCGDACALLQVHADKCRSKRCRVPGCAETRERIKSSPKQKPQDEMQDSGIATWRLLLAVDVGEIDLPEVPPQENQDVGLLLDVSVGEIDQPEIAFQENKAPAVLDLSQQNASETPVEYTPEQRKAALRQQQQRLLLLRHASKCQAPPDRCTATPHCAKMKSLWKHIAEGKCTDSSCKVKHCISSRKVLSHYHHCKDPKCDVCAPVKEIIAKSGKEQPHITLITQGSGACASTCGMDIVQKAAAEMQATNNTERSQSGKVQSTPREENTQVLGEMATNSTEVCGGMLHLLIEAAKIPTPERQRKLSALQPIVNRGTHAGGSQSISDEHHKKRKISN